MKRRELLTGVGVSALAVLGLVDKNTLQAASSQPNDIDLWKYAKIDPMKAAETAYEVYPQGACMYAVVRSLLETVAEELQFTDPLAFVAIKGFPFHMMGYGHRGIGATGASCGTFNGAAAVIGLFVKDADKRDAIIQELCIYYEKTELPQYRPQNDEFPNMPMVAPESVLCHISSSRWCVDADSKMFSPKRGERCRRLAADIAAKTAELLNRNHADPTCPFEALAQPTATCYDCHGFNGDQANSIGKMNCATCHDHDESHINQYFKPNK